MSTDAWFIFTVLVTMWSVTSLRLAIFVCTAQEQANTTPAGVVLGFIRASNPFVRMYQASGNILRRGFG